MTKFLTILSMFGSVASIVSLIVTFDSVVTPIPKWFMVIGFGVAFLLSLFVLFVPTPTITKNVNGKARLLWHRHFRHPKGHDLVQQRGEKYLPQSGKFTIAFDLPMIGKPDFVFDRPEGQPDIEIIAIEGTNVQFETRSGVYPATVKWMATGVPLEEIKTSKLAQQGG